MVKRAREFSSSNRRKVVMLAVLAIVLADLPIVTTRTGPVISATIATVVYGNQVPANIVVDGGERVTVDLTLANSSLPSVNLVATLAATGGVSNPTGPMNYGVIATDTSVTRQFRFNVTGACGDTVLATLSLQDGAQSLGSEQFPLTVGMPFAQLFDTVAVPALPPVWSTSVSGSGFVWVTNNASSFSGPNSAFATDPAGVGLSELISPAFNVPNATTLLQFKNSYNTENTFDGMVLEISINGAAFTDITTGGNVFISNGYNGTLSASFSNPLGGRQAWTGNSGGYLTSAINLPVAAQGQSVRLKWRMGMDSSTAGTGVRIDSVAVSSGITCNAVPQVFTDTLTSAVQVKGLHFTQVRSRIDAQRTRFALAAYPWTNPTLTPGTVVIQAAHILQMRAALADVWGPAGLIAPTYTDPGLAAGAVIKAVHLNELRSGVLTLETY